MAGNIQGGVPGRPYTKAGGLALRGDGNVLGSRQNINFVSTPGARPTGVDDATGDKVDISWELDTEVLLGEAVLVDLVDTSNEIVISAPTYSQAFITRILVIISSLSGTITTQPTVQAGTDIVATINNADIADQQMLDSGMDAINLAQELTLTNPRQTINANDTDGSNVLRFVVDIPAAGSTDLVYEVTVQAYGVITTV